MNITVVSGRSLAPDLVRRWSELQEADPTLSSPFLRPEFTQAVAAVRDDVYVGLLEQAGATVGFFPFQRGRFAIGRPVGGTVNNLQGIIVAPELEWDGSQLVRHCGLLEWKFGRLLTSQAPLEPFHLHLHRSMFIDVSRGYEAYAADKREAGIDPDNVQQLREKARKIARDVGPLRFELHSTNASHLGTLMRWKFERYAPHGYDDIFRDPWARRLVEHIHGIQTPPFAGLLSVLYAGDELAAVHLGFRSQSLLHSWCHAYNPKLARYSPGLMLFIEMARHARTVGLRSIELGGGDYAYKRALTNHSIVVAEGTVDRLSIVTTARRLRRTGERAIRQSPFLLPPARAINRALRGLTRLCR